MMAIRIMPTMVETPVSSARNVPDIFRMIEVPTTLDKKDVDIKEDRKDALSAVYLFWTAHRIRIFYSDG